MTLLDIIFFKYRISCKYYVVIDKKINLKQIYCDVVNIYS